MGVAYVVDASIINTIEALGSGGYSSAGVGGEISDKVMANALPTAAFINYLQTAKYEEDVTVQEYETNSEICYFCFPKMRLHIDLENMDVSEVYGMNGLEMRILKHL